jgi:hypothetical protein
LEKVLDQFHRFSNPSAVTGANTVEQAVGALDSSLGDPNAKLLSTAESGVSVDVQIPRFKMTAVVDDATEAESVLERAMDRATLAHYTGDSSSWDKDMIAMTDIGPSRWQNFTLQWLSRDRARVVFVVPDGTTGTQLPSSGKTPPVFAADDVRVKTSSSAFRTYAQVRWETSSS